MTLVHVIKESKSNKCVCPEGASPSILKAANQLHIVVTHYKMNHPSFPVIEIGIWKLFVGCCRSDCWFSHFYHMLCKYSLFDTVEFRANFPVCGRENTHVRCLTACSLMPDVQPNRKKSLSVTLWALPLSKTDPLMEQEAEALRPYT